MIELLLSYLALGALIGVTRGSAPGSELLRELLLWPRRVGELWRSDPSREDSPPPSSLSPELIRHLSSSLKELMAQETESTLLPDLREEITSLEQSLLSLFGQRESLRLALAQREPLQEVISAKPGEEEHPLQRQRQELREGLRLTQSALEDGTVELLELGARLRLLPLAEQRSTQLKDSLSRVTRVVETLEELRQLPALSPLPAESLPAARPSSSEPLPVAEVSSWQTRVASAGSILGLGGCSVLYHVLVGEGLEQSSALFVGLPSILAALVALTPAPVSATGRLMKLTTLLLLISGIFLREGVICILMAAPIFYSVALTAGLILDYLKRKRGRVARSWVLLPLLILSAEGTPRGWDLSREEQVTRTRVLKLSEESLEERLALKPSFEQPLPLLLQVGFPQPVQTWGQGLELGSRRVILFAGGEGKPGLLTLELAERGPRKQRWRMTSDGSHIAHWLSWQEAELSWEALEGGEIALDWTVTFRRELSPGLWFAPAQRIAVGVMIDYLFDSLVGPHAD